MLFKTTDGAVQGRNGVWHCHECGRPHAIAPLTEFWSRVVCCGRVFDLQNWDNPYNVKQAVRQARSLGLPGFDSPFYDQYAKEAP